eukprot:COSAG01_NODE_1641_length_9647_cov_5.299539_10_plen_71_part_00
MQGEQQFIAIEPQRLRPSGLTAEAQQRFCGLFWSKGDVGESTTRNIRAVSRASSPIGAPCPPLVSDSRRC